MNHRWRLVVAALTFAYGALAARLAYVQVWTHEALLAQAENQSERVFKDAPRRAPIVDRHGALLSESVPVASCFADPSLITRPGPVSRALAQALHEPAPEIAALLRRPGSFVWIKRSLSLEEAESVRKLSLPALGLKWSYERRYPNDRLAREILGRVGFDGAGLSGVELAFDRELTEPGEERRALRDGRGRALRSVGFTGKKPTEYQLRLTLDRSLQFFAEQELEKALADTRSRRGVLLAQDPSTGDILAMATRSRLAEDEGRWLAAQWVFEPGSTFKVVTAAAALDDHLVRTTDLYNGERGHWPCGVMTIHDHEPQGTISFARAMEVSSNVIFAKVGLQVGPERFYDRLKAFGFGSRTGLGLPGEEVGLVRPPSQWSRTSLPVLSFGQEVGVTALQMAAAYSAVANGGWLREPRLYLDLQSSAGHRVWEVPPPVRQVMSLETSNTLRELLSQVIRRGTGTEADLGGWTSAGKTGTAQKIDPATGRYHPEKNVASFCGMVPAVNPQLVIVVVLDEPQGVSWGGLTAGPVFRDFARRALSYLGVPSDRESQWVKLGPSPSKPLPIRRPI